MNRPKLRLQFYPLFFAGTFAWNMAGVVVDASLFAVLTRHTNPVISYEFHSLTIYLLISDLILIPLLFIWNRRRQARSSQ